MALTRQELSTMCWRSLNDKKTFWSEIAEKLVWTKKFTTVIDDSNSPFTKWFTDGELNMCYNCVDRHVRDGYGNKVAVIFDSPVSNEYREYNYREILDQVSRLAGVLTQLGVTKGDVVMIYMPIIPEGAWSMLACARIGAVHVCIPSGLTALELLPRIEHAQPKVIIMCSHGYHHDGWVDYKVEVDIACDKSKTKPQKILVFHRKNIRDRVSVISGRDLDFEEMMTSSVPVPCVSIGANEPLFMVYTSGSTGTPKAIVHGVGSFAVRIQCDAPLFFGKQEDDPVTFSTTYLGWIVGHFMVVYGPLIGRIKTVFFEGDPLLTDDVRGLYRILAKNKITTSFLRPGILKAVKGMDPHNYVSKEFDFTRLKHIYCGGERTDMNTMNWVKETFEAHVWNMWGQTELGSVLSGVPYISGENNSLIVWEFGKHFPGWDLYVEKNDGTQAKAYETGKLLVRLPLPPGGLLTIFKDDELYKKLYFTDYPGFFDTKDDGCLNEHGLVRTDCRTDDIMKIGAIYVSSQSLEEVIQKHEAVKNCVVVSTTDLVWKELPIALYTKNTDYIQEAKEIADDLKRMVIDKFGVMVRFSGAILVNELPLTMNGKVHRPSCRAMVRGQSLQGIGGVSNTSVFEDIIRCLKAENYGKNQLLD